jgi:D-alanine-D-alanine ligase
MNRGKLRVALVYGGRSAEREVSAMSARTVAAALDPAKYELIHIRIDSEGRWGRELAQGGAKAALGGAELVFPLLHGPYGEDGSIQGLARLADLPCVGAGVLGSALCMDKHAAKRIMRDSGIEVGRFRSFRDPADARAAWPEIEACLGTDLFVKPANLGSSVGVSRARGRAEYERAVARAFEYDLKVVVEETVVGREIEVAVLGDRALRASLPGEIVPRDGFYSYEAKYLDEDGAAVIAPAALTERESEACRALAIAACEALCVDGMARVDMFLRPDGKSVASEVNTIPGFTSRSMYPLLWEASGLPLPGLLDELIELAIEGHAERSALKSAPPAIR